MRDKKGVAKQLENMCKALPSGLRGIEIGSFAGESAEIMAKSGKFDKLFCVDPWESDDCEQCQAEKRFDEVARRNKCIVKCKGRLRNHFQEVGYVDFVYIDAQHNYRSTLKHIHQAFLIIKEGGIIGGHDYTNSWPEVVKAVHFFFPRESIERFGSNWVVRYKDFSDKL